MHSIKDTVKQLIGKSLDAYNKKYTSPINNRIDNIVAQAGTDNTEIVDARIDSAGVSHATLNNRILAETKMTDEKLMEYSGSSLSVEDTMPGYLQNIEIKGNTIQNEDNLEDIRSVGDKVEGQELYEIPVLSRGKNLFDGELEPGTYQYNNGVKIPSTTEIRSVHKIKVNPNSNYLISSNKPTENIGVYYYDSKENFIKSDYDGGQKIITTEDTHFIAFRFTNLDLDRTVQLEEGTVATPYEPHQEDKLTILSPTPLEKVGDVADRIVCKDGVWGVEKNTFRSYLKDFTWQINRTQENTTSFQSVTEVQNLTSNVYNAICKGFKMILSWDDEEHYHYGTYSSLKRHILTIAKNKVATIDDLNKFLLENNNYVVCIAEEPTFIPLPHDQQIKLRTFANKTNISFLTEIEGTIKAQVPKSLGATVNTHTEQINNLNKELDRVKKLEESTVSTVATESDFTTVDATSNGYFEDVKLEGKTLVNIHPKATPNFTVSDRDNPNYNVTKKEGYIKVTGSDLEATNYRYVSMGIINFEMFKPNTTYTIVFTKFRGSSKITIQNGNSQHPIVKGGAITAQDNKLLYTFVTTETLVKSEQILYLFINAKSTTVDVEAENPMIFEGDLTANPPSGYIEGLKSVGDGVDEISVESANENLFNGIVKKQLVSTNGLIIEDENGRSTDFIAVPSNCDLSVSVKKLNQDRNGVIEYNANKEFICFNNAVDLIKSGNYTFKTNINTKYIIYYYNSASQVADIPNHITVTTGTTPKPYTPHQSDKKRLLFYNNETQAWEKPILREWDSIEKHSDGKYYYHQRSGEVVLNGSENEEWDKNGVLSTDLYSFMHLQNQQIKPTNSMEDFICDKLIPANYNNASSECISKYADGTQIVIKITTSKLSTQDEAGFKQWLQANNVTVVYQLKEEKVYECTNIDLITYANETNYIVESGAIVPRTTLKVHNNISNIVSLLQKKVSLLESNMTKYMITQNRLQLSSTHSADSVTFKVDYTVCSENMSQENYDTDLYNLILNNILVGKDNYNYDHMFNIIMDYASWSQISWDQFDILVGLMDIQHNPPIEEIPTDDEIVEEMPNEII